MSQKERWKTTVAESIEEKNELLSKQAERFEKKIDKIGLFL
jgi:hypothetical protein